MPKKSDKGNFEEQKAAVKTVKSSNTKRNFPGRSTATRTQTAREKILIKDIEKLLPLLDEECLEALLQSAYNLASSLEEERERKERYEAFEQAVYETFKPKETKKDKSRQATKTTAKTASKSVSKSASQEQASAIKIERSDDGRFFNLVLGGKWKLFNNEEMAALARIALVKDPLEEVCPRVYAWLKRERNDVLSDFVVAGASSPLIRELVTLIRKNFRINKKT